MIYYILQILIYVLEFQFERVGWLILLIANIDQLRTLLQQEIIAERNQITNQYYVVHQCSIYQTPTSEVPFNAVHNWPLS